MVDPRGAHRLSPSYTEIKRLRSSGKCAPALSLLQAKRPATDHDAFEAVVCLFVCGQTQNAAHVCQTYPWKQEWAVHITSALTERLLRGDVSKALSLATRALNLPGLPYDASAIYLLLLKDEGLIDRAAEYVKTRLQNVPLGETFLLTIVAETALAARDWREAYRVAISVLASDPDDYRALVALSAANYEIGNIHESLGNALRAAVLDRASVPAVLQIMRCQNKLGDYYAALAAFEKLTADTVVSAEMHLELGTAYAGLEDRVRAIAEYRAALASGSRPIGAIRALLSMHATAGDAAELAALSAEYRAEIDSDIESLYWLALYALSRSDIDEAQRVFARTRILARERGEALHDLPWPVPEPRLRHDVEQLELLERRGRLDGRGREALRVLQRYYELGADLHASYSPAGAEANALKRALCGDYYYPELAYSGRALGENDYRAIEDAYLANRLVVIDNFLSPEALAVLRRFCEEATIWKIDNPRGYVGAVLAQGFSPRVLLTLSDELRQLMPRILGEHPLLQAWGFKYDQRMQGINMHADFAKVNVNFWVTPDEACADPATGGLVVYDVPVPKSWTFADYNTESEKLAAYVKVHDARPQRVPYKANRCVLFDSSLIHISDEMHFKPGYENRRLNVTLLYGRARSIE